MIVPDGDGYLSRLLGATACSGDGRPIGRVAAVYVDATGARPPAWIAILVDDVAPERLAPLARAWLYPGLRLVMAVTRSAVEGAPVAPESDLGADEERDVVAYYAPLITSAGKRPPVSAPDGATAAPGLPALPRLRRVVPPQGEGATAIARTERVTG